MAHSVIVKRGPVTLADRISDIHPEHWIQEIYDIVPQGGAPLTMFMDKMPSEKTTSWKYHWPEQPFNGMNGAVVDVFNDAALSSAYASGGVDGTILYITMTAANAGKFLESGDTVQIFNSSTHARRQADVQARVIRDDTTSYIQVRLGETDTSNALAGATLLFTIVGRAEGELVELPEAQYEEPTYLDNYIQHIMESMELSNRELREAERVNPKIRVRAKTQSFARFNKKREYMRFFSQKSQIGKVTKTRGLYNWILAEEPGNIINWNSDTTYSSSGATWNGQSLTFFQNVSELLARYSDASKKTCFTSTWVMNRINQAVTANVHYGFETKQNKYGLNIKTLKGCTQDWDIVAHPLFSTNDQFRYMMIVTEIPLLKTVTGEDVKFIPPKSRKQADDGYTYVSGEKGGWEVDEGFRINNIGAHAVLEQLGADKV